MCGIAGYINIDYKAIEESSLIISMLKVQKHRGPDDTGIRAFSLKNGTSVSLRAEYPQPLNGSFEGILGFNRLSILDLSMNGHQPMASPDNKVLLTLNGEIYNAFSYKDELESWGYKFKSTTDTEVVLALYLKYGFEGMLLRLNGMFAIVIVDLWQKRLYITRDRFGIKPMYYTSYGNVLAFSSELKSFGFLEGFDLKLNEDQVDEYLLFRNNLTGTLFKDVYSLQPGHYLSLKPGRGPTIHSYFDINDFNRVSKMSDDIEDYSERLEAWLSKSVESQLMSDVKLGCQLSGGIDSSLVTWLANRHCIDGNFESVSIILNDSRFSEEKYIDIVRETLGITAHKFILDSKYYLENIENATWHLEFPINHPNTIGIYKLSQQAKDYVTVLLSGEGADEVFGGYSWFYDLNSPFRPRRLIQEIRKNLHSPLFLIEYLDHVSRSIMSTAYILPATARSLKPDFSYERATAERRSLYKSLNGSNFDRQVKYEMKSYMPDLLIRQDKMSMAHSIENRVPFLDNEVVEKSFTIPENLLLFRNNSSEYNSEKYLLKKMCSQIFGNDFAFRQKMGFGIPLRKFFRDKEFTEYLRDKVLISVKQRGIYNINIVSNWINNIENLKYQDLEALWVVVSFEIWASIYLDRNNENRYTSH